MIIRRDKDILRVKNLLRHFPVTAILGPRQCGKTFLAHQLNAPHYFDLENPRDLSAFDNPQALLENLSGLIVIDEVQRRPELFPVLRYLVDHHPRQKYLILGSASGSLLKQSSESLAGRISYHYLSGFRLDDINQKSWMKLWLRGGLPKSFLASTTTASMEWLRNYITTFLERDIPQLGITIPAQTLRRFWMMLCHYHGQIINFSEVGQAFGVSDMTVRKYMDILEGVFMIRVLQPWHINIGKRLIKRPKIYLRDSGIFHHLMAIESEKTLTRHPKIGASWEGFALECLIRELELNTSEVFFWGTHSGAEADLIWQKKGKWWGAEFKYTDAPRLTKSMQSALTDLKLARLFVVYPGDRSYPLSSKISVIPLKKINDIKG